MTTPTESNSSARLAVADIVIVIAASTVAFLLELSTASRLPWGAEARGVGAVLVGAAVAVAVTFWRGRSLRDLGIKRPARWSTVPFWAFGILVVFIVAQLVVPVLVASVFELPAPDLSRYDYVRGNLQAAITLGLILPLTAAIPEEIVYRGFLIERFHSMFGDLKWSGAFAVLAQAFIFGLVHFQWGVGGIIMTMIMGAVWGFAFLLCGRNLWIVIIAHSTAHVALVMQLYTS